jgi:hypothetical protein
LEDLAALWNGIAFDESPYWIDPARVMKAVGDLTFVQDEERLPEDRTMPVR